MVSKIGWLKQSFDRSIILPLKPDAIHHFQISIILGSEGGMTSSTAKDQSESRLNWSIREALKHSFPRSLRQHNF